MKKLKIMLSGMIATVPYQGGATWAVLQYLLGFKRLGHDVHFVETIPTEALRPQGTSLLHSINAAYFHDVIREFGLEETSTLLHGNRVTVGLSYPELCRTAKECDLLINISGLLENPELLDPIPMRTYLDLDPGFTQLWHAAENVNMRFAGHHRHVTIGQAVGQPGCAIPTCGLSWRTTRQPVVLAHWPYTRSGPRYGLTTVGHWRAYGSIEYRGVLFGQKAHSFRRFIEVPSRLGQECTLALGIHNEERKDLALLEKNSWRLVDPAQVAGTPTAYRRFIQGSKAELGIVKSGYVAARCGWFSDRSICYLASGRPVLAQDTGFAHFLRTGLGLFSFDRIEEIVDAVRAIDSDYVRHSRGARALAEEYFDSDKVLPQLLDTIYL